MLMLKNGLGDPDNPEDFDKAWKNSTTTVDEDPTTAQEMIDMLEYKSSQ